LRAPADRAANWILRRADELVSLNPKLVCEDTAICLLFAEGEIGGTPCMRSHISAHRATTKYFSNSFVFKNEIEKEGLPRDSTPDLGAGGPSSNLGAPTNLFCCLGASLKSPSPHYGEISRNPIGSSTEFRRKLAPLPRARGDFIEHPHYSRVATGFGTGSPLVTDSSRHITSRCISVERPFLIHTLL
jgi:hypothetical protein